MRITPQDKKKIVSVLGLPHSGTTIVCNILNSMDNAFCISEPHWATISRPKHVRFDKIGSLNNLDVNNIMDNVSSFLDSSPQYSFGGVKETFRPFNPQVKKCLDKIVNVSDIIVYVLRDSAAHYNSLKKVTAGTKQNPIPIERIINDMTQFEKTISQTKNKIILTIEDLCKSGNDGAIQYINSKSNGHIKIEGEFKLKPTNYIYGNNVANRSSKIKATNMTTGLLTQKDRDIIADKIMPIYDRILKMGN